jgi:hypothetical protein
MTFWLSVAILERFSPQVVRCLGFALQAIHYWLVPTA